MSVIKYNYTGWDFMKITDMMDGIDVTQENVDFLDVELLNGDTKFFLCFEMISNTLANGFNREEAKKTIESMFKEIFYNKNIRKKLLKKHVF